MKLAEQAHVAGVVREYRKRLERAAAQVEGSSELAHEFAAIVQRLRDVEGALLVEVRQEGWTLRRVVELLTSPMIRIYWQHSPRALRVPSEYLTTSVPPGPLTISIVTPSYQQGEFVERTIYSVLSQDYPNLEYNVQDAGSTDETPEVLRRYDDRLTRWVSEPDDGQADAINRGFEGTTGEVMAYLNSDDLLLPGSLAYVARYFARHPAVDVVYGHRIIIDQYDRQIGAWILPRHDDRMLTLADYVPQETLFWRREAWERAGGRMDASFQFALDWDLLLRLRETGAKMVRVPRFLGAFRVHDHQKNSVLLEVGEEEQNLIRRRVHGRPMTTHEAWTLLQPYLRRHTIAHHTYRLARRIPIPRTRVQTLPRTSAAPTANHESKERPGAPQPGLPVRDRGTRQGPVDPPARGDEHRSDEFAG